MISLLLSMHRLSMTIIYLIMSADELHLEQNNQPQMYFNIQLLYTRTYLNVAVNLLQSRIDLIMTNSGDSLIWTVWDK